MTGGKPEGFKLTVKQEYSVYLYFAEGINVDDDDEKYAIILDSAIESAFQHEGLAAVRHEDTDTHNGYLAHVTTYDPTVTLDYNTDGVPRLISVALQEEGFNSDD